jgi:hypothetical protein
MQTTYDKRDQPLARTGIDIRFMIEPGILEMQAQVLVPNLRHYLRGTHALSAYCRNDRIDRLCQKTVDLLYKWGIRLNPINNPFKMDYGAGNKCVLAALPSEYSHVAILDTDVFLMREADFNDIARHGIVSVVPETRNAWSRRPMDWSRAYQKLGVPYHKERITLLYGEISVPFYNAGMVLFPQGEFGATWLDLALRFHQLDLTRKEHTFTDQITLPMAAKITQGIEVCAVDAIWNSSADCKIEEEARILLHYHRLRKISRNGMTNMFERMLSHVGARYTTISELSDFADEIGADVSTKALKQGQKERQNF